MEPPILSGNKTRRDTYRELKTKTTVGCKRPNSIPEIIATLLYTNTIYIYVASEKYYVFEDREGSSLIFSTHFIM